MVSQIGPQLTPRTSHRREGGADVHACPWRTCLLYTSKTNQASDKRLKTFDRNRQLSTVYTNKFSGHVKNDAIGVKIAKIVAQDKRVFTINYRTYQARAKIAVHPYSLVDTHRNLYLC